MDDLISRQAAIDAIENAFDRETILNRFVRKIAISAVRLLPSVQPEIIRCKDCKHWRQQTNYQGAPLFGFCESDDMWQRYTEKQRGVIDTDDDFYCGYAERRTDGRD